MKSILVNREVLERSRDIVDLIRSLSLCGISVWVYSISCDHIESDLNEKIKLTKKLGIDDIVKPISFCLDSNMEKFFDSLKGRGNLLSDNIIKNSEYLKKSGEDFHNIIQDGVISFYDYNPNNIKKLKGMGIPHTKIR